VKPQTLCCAIPKCLAPSKWDTLTLIFEVAATPRIGNSFMVKTTINSSYNNDLYIARNQFSFAWICRIHYECEIQWLLARRVRVRRLMATTLRQAFVWSSVLAFFTFRHQTEMRGHFGNRWRYRLCLVPFPSHISGLHKTEGASKRSRFVHSPPFSDLTYPFLL